MKLKTQSTVTITMSGTEANELAVQLNELNVDILGGPAATLLLALRELPEEVVE